MPLGINENPAPGYRSYSSGVLASVGYHGYSWSSAVSSTSGVFLYFYTRGLDPSSVNSRGRGLQLRCLSE